MQMFFLFSYLLAGPAIASEFSEAVSGEASSLRSTHPELAVKVDTMKPVLNRAGGLFFPGKEWTDPKAQRLIQDRLMSAKDDLDVRVALAYALTEENRLPWAEIATQEEAVRVALLANYKKTGSSVLLLALADESPLVRAEAARLSGYQEDASGLDVALIGLLSDDSVDIRRSSVRSLGWLEVKEAYPAIRRLLTDTDAGIRHASLRALGNIDSEQTRALPELEQLKLDADPAVARKATALQR